MDGAVMPELAELPRSWTFEDLERLLPDDVDWRRYEIVDGALVVSPPPASRHGIAIGELAATLRAAVPPGYTVIEGFGVDLGTSYRVPDLVVLPLAGYVQGRNRAEPGDVLLAVEVVSPGSRTSDRVLKPAQYAAAGIPAYWRLETDPQLSLSAYLLEAGAAVYTEVGTWGPGQTARIERPFPADIPIDTLIPRA
jgi:Uma2 family endonuclease